MRDFDLLTEHRRKVRALKFPSNLSVCICLHASINQTISRGAHNKHRFSRSNISSFRQQILLYSYFKESYSVSCRNFNPIPWYGFFNTLTETVLLQAKSDMVAYKNLRSNLTPTETIGHIEGVKPGLRVYGKGELAILGVHCNICGGIYQK